MQRVRITEFARRAGSAGESERTETPSLDGTCKAKHSEGVIFDILLVPSDFRTARATFACAHPLVAVEYSRRAMTHVAAAKGTAAPMGRTGRLREPPDTSCAEVTAPNADTPYSHDFWDAERVPCVVRQVRPDDAAGAIGRPKANLHVRADAGSSRQTPVLGAGTARFQGRNAPSLRSSHASNEKRRGFNDCSRMQN